MLNTSRSGYLTPDELEEISNPMKDRKPGQYSGSWYQLIESLNFEFDDTVSIEEFIMAAFDCKLVAGS